MLIPVSSEACSICLSAFRASLLAVQPGANPPQEAADLDFVAMANSIGGAMISLSYLITDPFLYHRCVDCAVKPCTMHLKPCGACFTLAVSTVSV